MRQTGFLLSVFGLLILEVYVASSAGNLTVFQYPGRILAAEGTDVILNCLFHTYHVPKVGQASWRKGSPSGQHISAQYPEYEGRLVLTDSTSFIYQKNASLQIRQVRKSDAGHYYCEVEIHNSEKRFGNGTILEIIEASSKDAVIYQHPLYITAIERDTASISCYCYPSPQCSYTRISLLKMPNSLEVSENILVYKGRTQAIVSHRDANNITETSVQIKNLSLSDTGEYICEGYISGEVVRSQNSTVLQVVSTTGLDGSAGNCNSTPITGLVLIWTVLWISLSLASIPVSWFILS
ncbi:uncharacterized protein LOC122810895 [Protopterus annectens]|uniref:uncharacterized protein LOC122810895 n=1 Tax=Protopterus annectens TaxID=7888 RepID=UPI001CFC2ADA|nr:uncharacterized protein LOC122810895 [Protopterus annectens]